MPYPLFDRSQLQVRPLAEREHDMHLDDVMALDAEVAPLDSADLDTVIARIRTARENDRPVIILMGAHVLKQGLARFLIKLLEEGWVTHLGGNGACAIHDYEMALIGATTESVARYIREGQFGLWQETGGYNDAAKRAVAEGTGFGEALGRTILEGNFPHQDLSVFAAAARCGVPATVHIGIGSDIAHELPNCDGAALGQASYTDFLIFTQSMTRMEGGVFLNFGTAVMGPEVYLKALSMVRNVARQRGEQIAHFTTAAFDLVELPDDFSHTPTKSQPGYYYRPWKTILVRTVADGGESFYIRGDHKQTMTSLYRGLSR
ncbi:MAG TPA: hypothetical protein VGM19_10940 [Armatimonadota bacterium]|jgi:hypothetical protein